MFIRCARVANHPTGMYSGLTSTFNPHILEMMHPWCCIWLNRMRRWFPFKKNKLVNSSVWLEAINHLQNGVYLSFISDATIHYVQSMACTVKQAPHGMASAISMYCFTNEMLILEILHLFKLNAVLRNLVIELSVQHGRRHGQMVCPHSTVWLTYQNVDV